MNKQYTGLLMVAASAAGFATLAIFIKIAYAAGANAPTVLAFRFSLAALALWAIVFCRGIPFRLPARTVGWLAVLGILGYGVMSLLFAAALQYLPASLTSMLLYAYPAIVCLLSIYLGDDTFSWAKGLALTVCFSGLCLVLGVSFAQVHTLGVLLGLGAAVIYSGYIVASNRVVKDVDPLVATAYVCASAAVAFGLYAVGSGSLVLSVAPEGWLAFLGIAFFGTVVGILGLLAGLARIGATNASIISTMEPGITTLLSVVVLQERITTVQISGGALIIAGILILQLWPRLAAVFEPASDPSA